MKEISLHILDIVQNSLRADAKKITVKVTESMENKILIIEIIDNGRGIPGEILQNIADPFVTTRKTRKVGMGLSLLKQHAEMTGGNMTIESVESQGTRVTVVFRKDHIDIQPMGDLPGVIKLLIAANPGVEFIYCHSTDRGKYSFSTGELKEVLEISKLNDVKLLNQVKSMMLENLKDIGAEL